MQQYDKVIHDIKRTLNTGDIRVMNDWFNALEFALEILSRENKILNNLDMAYTCDSCGQIFAPEEINNSTREYFKDRLQVVEPIENVSINFAEYICPRCGHKAIGKEFKRLK